MKRKIMAFMALILLLIVFQAPNSLGAPKEASSCNDGAAKLFSLKQLHADFAQFKTTLTTQHPMLYTNKGELQGFFDTQYQLLNHPMDELEFYRILSPIVTKLNCGHTGLNFSQEYEESIRDRGRYLPLLIRVISGRAYVYRNLGAAPIPEGAELLAINGRVISEIIAIFLNNITADGSNTSKKYYVMNQQFANLYFSFIASPEKFIIRYRNPDGQGIAETELAAVGQKQFAAAARNRDPAVQERNNALYRQQFRDGTAVLTVKSFNFYDAASRGEFKVFLDDFFKTVAQQKCANLILDLRDNWGGDPYCASYLFKYLIQRPAPYFAADTPYYYDLIQPLEPESNHFQGALDVLINGASFSSTGHLCSLLRFQRIGTFIGEETGGSFACTDGSRDITLKYTRLRLHYATGVFKTAVAGLTPGRGIVPDYTVTPTIDDYLQGKDVALEVALGLKAPK